MKILIFSDTHLTSFFDQGKYDFLKNILESADQVVINGDFWDGYLVSFDRFLRSRWAGLFPLLLSKNTIYISGNHDNTDMVDDRYKLFAKEFREDYTLSSGSKKFYIEHGHKSAKTLEAIVNPPIAIRYLGRRLSWFSLQGENILTSIYKWDLLQKRAIGDFYTELNQTMKISVKDKAPRNAIIINSHTHRPEFDKDGGFINTGCIKGGVGSYVMIENGKYSLIEDTYQYQFKSFRAST